MYKALNNFASQLFLQTFLPCLLNLKFGSHLIATNIEQAIEKHVDALKTLKGPVYDVEGKNHYEAIVKHVESLKGLQGPVYDFGKSGHAFSEVVKGVEDAMKQLHGPKYEVDSGIVYYCFCLIKKCSHDYMVRVTHTFYGQLDTCQGNFHNNFCMREEPDNPACVGQQRCVFKVPWIYLSRECGYSNNFLIQYQCIPGIGNLKLLSLYLYCMATSKHDLA